MKRLQEVFVGPQELDGILRSVDLRVLRLEVSRRNKLFQALEGMQREIEPSWKRPLKVMGTDFSAEEWAEKIGVTTRHFVEWAEDNGLLYKRLKKPIDEALSDLRRPKKRAAKRSPSSHSDGP